MSLCKASCKSSGISFESLKVYYLREFNDEELLLDYSAVEVCQCEGPHGDSDKFASNEKNPILQSFSFQSGSLPALKYKKEAKAFQVLVL